MVSVSISGGSSETGALLTRYLRDRGIYSRDQAGAHVCYGVRPATRPMRMDWVLNWNCKGDKISRMKTIEAAGGRLIPWATAEELLADMHLLDPPLLARAKAGQGGTDIVTVLQKEEIPWRIAAGWDWFSEYIPVRAEYRVWVWRGEHLDSYEKVMRRPQDYAFIGRNFRNGFDFEVVDGWQPAIDQAVLATKALGLDFAAVDLLRGTDDYAYILEVNTAPGVIKSGAERTLGALADRIKVWDDAGHPGA